MYVVLNIENASNLPASPEKEKDMSPGKRLMSSESSDEEWIGKMINGYRGKHA